MKRLYYLVVVFTIATLIGNTLCFGQVAGKLFPEYVANQKYGAVIDSVEFPIKNLKNWLNQSHDYIMFKIVNNSLIVLDQDRKVIYPTGAKVDTADVFSMYSKSVVEDLISVGDTKAVVFQQREKVLTVTVGNVTMEVSALCPPFCSGQ